MVLLNHNPSFNNSFGVPNIDVYKSSYPVSGIPGNIDVLSTEGFFTYEKERSITAHS